MSFENTIWLYLAPAFGLFAAMLIGYGLRQRTQLLQKFAAERLLPQLTEQAPRQRTFIKAALVIIGVILVTMALSRPQYGVTWTEQKARGLDIVFALDSSKSMLANDIRPTRLDRAKLAIQDLMGRLESDRVGLVAFAGQAFLQTPPTLDYSAFRESLEATSPAMLSRGGSDIGHALEEASKAFPSESNVKVVVLLTDGEDLGGQAIKAAQNAAEEGIQIFTIGIGTPEGTYLRIASADGSDEFVRDNQGQPVRSQLDETTLQEIATISGGAYSRLNSGALEQLYDSVLATLPREERNSELKETKIERFQWFLGIALFFFVLEMLIRSRGRNSIHTAALIFVATMLIPDVAQAEDVEQKNYEELAFNAMENGDFATAKQHYETSIRDTSDLTRQRDALYNMGHAQHQIARESYANGDLEAALEQIQEAEAYFQSAQDIIQEDDDISDDVAATAAVREAIEKIIEQQQEQDGESQENESSEEQDQENSEEDSEREQNQDGQEQQQDEEGESDSSEQEQSESSEGSESEEQDSESSEGESKNSESEQSSESKDSTDPQSGQEEQDSEQTEEEQQSGTQQDDESDEQEEQQSTQEVPEVTEGEEGSTSSESAMNEATPVQGMTIEQAQDLLDSLREREEILPFNRATLGQGRPLQDW